MNGISSDRILRPVISFPALVGGTFLLGWVIGLAAVLHLWRVMQVPGWMMVSGWGYISLMLLPVSVGIAFTRLAARLTRGFGMTGAALALLGVVALVGGLLLAA